MRNRLPKLIESDDYHDFGDFESDLKQLDPKLRCCEVGFIEREAPHSTYLGVIYKGRKPSKKKLQQMVDEKDFGGLIEL